MVTALQKCLPLLAYMGGDSDNSVWVAAVVRYLHKGGCLSRDLDVCCHRLHILFTSGF